MICTSCSQESPDGVFCTRCGAHQATTGAHRDHAQRPHSYAAHPHEHVLHPGVFTTLLPHLGHTKVHEFRWAFLAGLAGVFALFFAGLITTALCVAAVLVPALYLIYLYEAQVYRDEPLLALGLTIGLGAALGVGVTLLTDRLAPDAAAFGFGLDAAGVLVVAVAIPAIQEVVKPIPALLLRGRPSFGETMDGLTFGIAAGLGFGVAETFVRFSGLVVDMPFHSRPANWVYPLVTTAVLLPLLQGTTTGAFAAACWRLGKARANALVLGGIAIAFAGHIAFTLGTQLLTQHGWSQLVVLAFQALVDVCLLIYVRLLLHHALLEEAADLGFSEKVCMHCHTTVMAAGFCSSCGLALTAVPTHARTPGFAGTARAGVA